MIERRPRTLPALQHGDHRRLLRFGTARLGGPPWSLAGPLAGGRGPARSRAGLALARGRASKSTQTGSVTGLEFLLPQGVVPVLPTNMAALLRAPSQ